MSNVQPTATCDRDMAYLKQHGWTRLTPRQARQLARMDKRAHLRDRGELKHGASGVRVRKPLARSAASRGVS